ncbi:hypothetical protein H4Q32_016572 [Labeo rohita]|uniref:Sleeping Beauty transposase HTH domain-containing protein n=1 Tax=Labeo rohita TaxID=84645 RepID=A0ABQ8M7D5_LABRO|nr:hypothetical protein H4Q32_016572 [Labeo rohita]
MGQPLQVRVPGLAGIEGGGSARAKDLDMFANQWILCSEKVPMEKSFKFKELSVDLREKTVEKYGQPQGYKSISRDLNVPVSTVCNIIKRFTAHGTVVNLPGHGQKTKFAYLIIVKVIDGNKVWTGVTDSAEEGTWTWVTSTTVISGPENQWWLGYLGWILQNGSLSLSVSEPETPTRLIQEPEPENTKSPETKHADQSTIEPEADMNLIDLLLEAPVPSGDLPPPMSLSDFLVPYPPLVSARSLDLSAPLVTSRSSALPPSLAPYGSSASPQASPPQTRPVCPKTPLGSLIHPNKPRSVVAQHPPQTSGSQAMPRPSTPSASPGASLPLVSPSSLLALSSLYLSLKPVASPWVSTLLMSPWSVGLCAPPVPALTLVQPLVTGFRVLPSPLPKAPPWFLPRQAEGTLHNTEFVEVEV